MISEVCRVLRNWFEVEKFYGDFEIKDGEIKSLNDGEMGIQEGQYFRIIGSVFNDGVHQFPTNSANLQDEEFNGAVWLLAIPKDLVQLSDEIDAWNEKYTGVDSAAMSPFNSESFGGYSYSKSSGGNADGTGGSADWKSVFAHRLNQWRKI